MKTHASEWIGLQKAARFLFCSDDSRVAALLGEVLGEIGMLTQEEVSADTLSRRLAEITPQVLFLDFTLDPEVPGKLLRASDLARLLTRVAPTIPRVAVGRIAQPEGAIAALRAGVTEFVDPSVAPDEVREVVRRMLAAQTPQTGGVGSRGSVLLLGARPGVGTSTLTVHLAGIVQDRLVQANLTRRSARGDKLTKAEQEGARLPLEERVGILDLGWPVGDCQLYLNLQSDFHFAEAVRNLRRLDPTLLGAAMSHTSSGISALALPRDLGEMRGVSQSDSLQLFERLRQHFGLLLVDAGGFSNPEFVLGLARSSQQTWLVTDQSVGSLVSLAEALKALETQQVERDTLRLVVSKYDERYGMSAAQIAERFNLPLAGILPDRTLALVSAANEGKLMHEVSERDPYVRAIHLMAEKLAAQQNAPGARAGWMKTWLPGVQRRISLL
jgi:pilus assembly protein CpaE